MALLWDVDENTLYETAGRNTPAFFGGKIIPITEVMEQLSKETAICGRKGTAENGV